MTKQNSSNTYNHLSVEKKWQKYWEENKVFSVKNNDCCSELEGNQKTFYALDMFPFPSGAGLHVGHPEGYTATDIICRKRRMEGYKVLHPMGWDAFGLPAENFAIKTGVHPKKSTNQNIENFQRQIKSLGFSYDWDREFATTDEDYYKHTQELFLKLYDKNLLYEDDKPLNWCASCKVVCANEEVEQGLHERCGNVVTKKALKQWMFKITDYAERLLQDLEKPNVVLLHGWGGNGSLGWFGELTKYLKENKISVTAPSFPNTENPVYAEWKETFEKEVLPNINANTIILGHSLGCGFIQRYLSEENLQISELVLVAPTVSDCGIEEIKNFFTQKKRGCIPETGCCSKDNMAKPSQSDYIFSNFLTKVKKKNCKKRQSLKDIKKIVEVRNKKIIFDGEMLFSHFLSKPHKERNYRQNLALTIIKSIPDLKIQNNLGYIEFKNQIFKIVFSSIDNTVSQVKTFYRSEKLTKEYLEFIKNKKSKTKEIKENNVDNVEKFNFNYEKIKHSAHNIFIIAGEKDEYITQDEFKFLEKKLNANLTVFKNKGHFGQGESLSNVEVLDFFKKTVASVLDWPKKIKAMQRNWIGKSEGITISYPAISEYKKTYIQKKRGTKGAHPRKENFSDSIRFSRIGNIIFSELQNVNKKKYNNQIEDIQKIFEINNEKITFDGFSLLEHWKRKNQKEIKDRRENAITVIKALPFLWYETEEIAYFKSGNTIFRVVFEIVNKNEKRIKTYYKVSDLSIAYKQAKQNDTLSVKCYTTRPDTNFGATFVTLAPEHKLITENLETLPNAEEVKKYVQAAASKSDIERMTDNKEKTGVFTGLYVLHPANNKKLPLYVGDFVLAHVGTGAVVGVPGHDMRDFEFAQKFDIPVIKITTPKIAKYTIIEKSIENAEKIFQDFKKSGLISDVKVKSETEDWGKFFEVSVSYKKEKEFLQFLQNNLLSDPISGAKSFYADSIGTSNITVFRDKIIEVIDNKSLEEFKEYGKSLNIPEEQLDIKVTAFVENGIIINSDFLDGLESLEAKEKISEYYIEKNWATKEVNYKLRDWIFTRQRYWGEPIPLVFDKNGKCFALDSSELPLVLPESANYEPSATGESPLAKITDWVNVEGYITDENKVIICDSSEVPENKKYQKFTRETSTMPNWAGSSWYWLRYMDPKNSDEAWSKNAENQWGPVDLYVGGAEHAVLHLLYARFWHKAFYDLGLVSTKEPFKKLVNQGLILSYAYQRNTGGLVPVDEVEEKVTNTETGEKQYFEISTGEEVEKIVAKMSKSLKNVVNPDDIVNAYGADTLRMYEMFMGPFEQSKAWDTTALEGMHRFLMKIWRLFTEKEILDACPSKELIKLTHQTVKKVSHDIDEFKFNTAISQMMVWVNSFQKLETIPKISGGKFVRLLSPFAPHLAEELWQKFSPEDETISFKSWPSYKEELLVEDEVTYAVQVNGKLRGDFKISKEAEKDECIKAAKNIEKVAKFIQEGIDNGGQIRKEIFVPGKIVGFVVK